MTPQTTLTISLPEPCGENWDAMQPNACGRFCTACEKTVMDFTVMTDAEILKIFRNSETPPCGRFLPEQLNRPLQEPKELKPFPFYRKIAAAILALQAFTIASFAQGKKKPVIAAHDKKLQRGPLRAIKGVLLADKDRPAANTPLLFTATGYDTLFATTDEHGCFLFELPDGYQPATARIVLEPAYAEANNYIVNHMLELSQETLHKELTVYRFTRQILPEAQVLTRRPDYYGSGLGGIPVATYNDFKKPTPWKKFTKPFKKRRKR